MSSLLSLRKRPGYLRPPFAWAAFSQELRGFGHFYNMEFIPCPSWRVEAICLPSVFPCRQLVLAEISLSVTHSSVFGSHVQCRHPGSCHSVQEWYFLFIESQGPAWEDFVTSQVCYFCQLMFPIIIISCETHTTKMNRALLVNMWRFEESGHREGPFPVPCPVHLFHLAVPELYPLKPVS